MLSIPPLAALPHHASGEVSVHSIFLSSSPTQTEQPTLVSPSRSDGPGLPRPPSRVPSYPSRTDRTSIHPRSLSPLPTRTRPRLEPRARRSDGLDGRTFRRAHTTAAKEWGEGLTSQPGSNPLRLFSFFWRPAYGERMKIKGRERNRSWTGWRKGEGRGRALTFHSFLVLSPLLLRLICQKRRSPFEERCGGYGGAPCARVFLLDG